MGTGLQPGIFEVRYCSHTGLNNSDITPSQFCAHFSCEPSFRLHGLSYMNVPEANWLGYVDGGGGFFGPKTASDT
jgi:hypothetical protein